MNMASPHRTASVPQTGILPRAGRGIVLRRFAAKDLARFQAYRHDPGVACYQGWSPMDADAAASFVAEMASCPLFERGAWTQLAVADLAGDTLLGDVGVCIAGDGSAAEIGFTICAASQRAGIGGEAVRLALALVFEHAGVGRIVAITDTRNVACLRLLRRVGLREAETKPASFKGEPCLETTFVAMRGDIC